MFFSRGARTVVGSLLAALLIAGCGGGDETPATNSPATTAAAADPGPVHVHGLGVSPEDDALLIATHTGLFRMEEGGAPKRVGDSHQDTMGFAVAEGGRFLGSGHPDLREKLPPYLGLVESRDGGATWKPVSLLGKKDFHVLETQGKRVYGFGSDFETRQEALLVSSDAGRTWDERGAPESLVALAIDPSDPDRVVASGRTTRLRSTDAARSWKRLGGDAALLAWPATDALYALGGDGRLARSADAGSSWKDVSTLDAEPAAFEARSARELYVALHDGRIVRSTDAGATWSSFYEP